MIEFLDKLIALVVPYLTALGTDKPDANGVSWPKSAVASWSQQREGQDPIESLTSYLARTLSLSELVIEGLLLAAAAMPGCPFRVSFMTDRDNPTLLRTGSVFSGGDRQSNGRPVIRIQMRRQARTAVAFDPTATVLPIDDSLQQA